MLAQLRDGRAVAGVPTGCRIMSHRVTEIERDEERERERDRLGQSAAKRNFNQLSIIDDNHSAA